MDIRPTFFVTAKDFRKWLKANHQQEKELIVGYYKKATKLECMTWSESVDQALCFGWIDGIRRSIDEKSYSIRFTPRRKNSNWSAVNLKKYEELSKAGLMEPAGKAIFLVRKEINSKRYAYEQGTLQLSKTYENKLKANKKAWAFFDTLPPSAKKPTIWWVMSAVK